MPLLQPEDTLALHTVLKNDIGNFLFRGPPIAGHVGQVKAYISEYADCKHRTTQPCLRYNCHGLTFASRRTAITDTSEVQKDTY